MEPGRLCLCHVVIKEIYLFAQKFDIQIVIFLRIRTFRIAAHEEKTGVITGSDFLNDLEIQQAITRSIQEIESSGIGRGKTNYRLRDAVFSRQRYWGEPFPIYFVDETPFLVDDEKLPVELPRRR